MLHRIRLAMSDDETGEPLSGDVEVDETYVGGKPCYRRSGNTYKGRVTRKQPVVVMVERNGGVRTKPVGRVTVKFLKEVILNHVAPESRIITDSCPCYRGIGHYYQGGHQSVNHNKGEYVRGDIHSITVEGYFSLVKRSINGIYHSISKKHMHRYMDEFFIPV